MPTQSNPIIQIKGLSVKYGDQEVLTNVSANVSPKEIIAVIGPNGSGKTTLLKCILGLLPYTGEIKVFDKPPKKVVWQIGYVPQRFSFDKNFPLTIAEFLHLTSKNDSAIKKALQEVEMDSYYNKPLGKLSGGQLQRVLIARAIVNNPTLLLLDEPTAGVDQEGEKDFYEIIKHQNEVHGTTIVMISHEINVVYAHATQVLCLNKNLCCMGKPKEVLTDEIIKQLYGPDATLTAHRHQ